MSKSLTEQMQEKISNGLESAFESVLNSQNEYYQKHPEKIPNEASIDALIRGSVTQNAAISGGASLIPGPWGMLAVVPELLVVIRNQIKLIYDIGAALGKKEIITRELLLGIFISAAGASAGSLLVITGSKVLVRRASLQVMQKMIALLGGKITQQALKSAISKWLPGIGAAAMAAWSGYLTKQIGDKAREIFKQDIVNDPDTTDIELIKPVDVVPATSVGSAEDVEGALEFCKIQVLINLAKIDGHISKEEQYYIDETINSPELSDTQKERLRAAVSGKSEAIQGIELVASRPDSAIALLATMVALAKKDGEFHITEKLYTRKIGALLGFSDTEINDFFNNLTHGI